MASWIRLVFSQSIEERSYFFFEYVNDTVSSLENETDLLKDSESEGEEPRNEPSSDISDELSDGDGLSDGISASSLPGISIGVVAFDSWIWMELKSSSKIVNVVRISSSSFVGLLNLRVGIEKNVVLFDFVVDWTFIVD